MKVRRHDFVAAEESDPQLFAFALLQTDTLFRCTIHHAARARAGHAGPRLDSTPGGLKVDSEPSDGQGRGSEALFTGCPWSLVARPYWGLLARLGVIHWSLVAQTNI